MNMPFVDLQSVIKPLPRLEKLRLVEWMIADMTREEAALTLKSGDSYPIWSPYEAYDAAEILLQVEKTTIHASFQGVAPPSLFHCRFAAKSRPERAVE